MLVERADGSRIDYSLDPGGRRIAKRVDGVLVRSWLYESDLRPAAEFDGSGALRSRFVYGGHSNAPEFMIGYADGNEAGRFRFVVDHIGSVRLVVDSVSGAVVQRMDYDAWGAVAADSNPGFQPFGFAGGLWDAETLLVRFGARDYDPAVGRWTSRDPVLFEGGDANVYAYVGNDPVNFIDPGGLVLGDCAGAFAAAWYAEMYKETGSWYFLVGGALASLWTPATSGKTAGVLLGAYGAAKGPELKLGPNWRVAPFGNRTGKPTGEPPHYHRRGSPLPDGQTPPGQGIGRHRPWQTKSTDTSFWDRF